MHLLFTIFVGLRQKENMNKIKGASEFQRQKEEKETIFMDETIYLNKLEQRKIKPTAIRLLILKTMMQRQDAFSMTDLENELDTVDKSTIYRTLTLFLAHHLIHGINNGTGALKYAVCSNDCNCEIDDQHTHFYCEKCHRTFCLKHIHVPVVPLPPGFTIQSIGYVLKGLCSECSSAGATLLSAEDRPHLL